MRNAICVTALLALVAATPLAAQPRKPKPVAKTEVITLEGTVVAIDYTKREVTIKGSGGDEVTVHVAEEVTRFPAIKIGDIVKAKYVEATVMAIRDPHKAPATGEPEVTKTPGDKPGGVKITQVDSDVTVKEIDHQAPSLTVTTADGRTLAFKVEDPKRIEKLKVGDVIRITYIESMALTVESPKAK